MTKITSLRASDFISTLGVNTHVPYTDGLYASIGSIAADLAYLGINQVRDGLSNGANGSAPLPSFVTLAQQAIHFTFGVEGASQAALAATLGLVDQVAAAAPGSITAIEGANEINNWPVTFEGVGGLQAITQAHFERVQALTVWRMISKALVPGRRRAVSTTVRISASPAAAHIAR